MSYQLTNLLIFSSEEVLMAISSHDFTATFQLWASIISCFIVFISLCNWISVWLGFSSLFQRLFNSSSLCAIRVVSSAYLGLLVFLPEILIPACASLSPAFLMMYSAYQLNKHSDNMQSWHTPFPIWNQSVVPCPVLTVASWPAYRFFKRQVRWSGIPISFRIFHSLLWSTESKSLA